MFRESQEDFKNSDKVYFSEISLVLHGKSGIEERTVIA
jgi:fructose/tagatose bisphosphate aldolase